MTESAATSAETQSSGASAAHAADRELVRAILEGDEQRLDRFVRELHGTLVRMARALLGNSASAEEVVQEVWLAVVRSLRQYEGRSSLKTWVISILINRARTRAKRESRSFPLADVEQELRSPSDDVAPARYRQSGFWASPPAAWDRGGPERQALSKELAGVLERELEQLPAGQRAVVILRDVDGLSGEEVCNVLGLSESNQRVLLHRGRCRLRAALERYLEA